MSIFGSMAIAFLFMTVYGSRKVIHEKAKIFAEQKLGDSVWGLYVNVAAILFMLGISATLVAHGAVFLGIVIGLVAGWQMGKMFDSDLMQTIVVHSKQESSKESVMLQDNTELEKAKKELGKLRKLLVNAGIAKWEPRARDGVMQFKVIAPVVAEVVKK